MTLIQEPILDPRRSIAENNARFGAAVAAQDGAWRLHRDMWTSSVAPAL